MSEATTDTSVEDRVNAEIDAEIDAYKKHVQLIAVDPDSAAYRERLIDFGVMPENALFERDDKAWRAVDRQRADFQKHLEAYEDILEARKPPRPSPEEEAVHLAMLSQGLALPDLHHHLRGDRENAVGTSRQRRRGMSEAIDWSVERLGEMSDEELASLHGKASSEYARSCEAVFRAESEQKKRSSALAAAELARSADATDISDSRKQQLSYQAYGPPWSAYNSLKCRHDKIERALATLIRAHEAQEKMVGSAVQLATEIMDHFSPTGSFSAGWRGDVKIMPLDPQ